MAGGHACRRWRRHDAPLLPRNARPAVPGAGTPRATTSRQGGASRASRLAAASTLASVKTGRLSTWRAGNTDAAASPERLRQVRGEANPLRTAGVVKAGAPLATTLHVSDGASSMTGCCLAAGAAEQLFNPVGETPRQGKCWQSTLPGWGPAALLRSGKEGKEVASRCTAARRRGGHRGP